MLNFLVNHLNIINYALIRIAKFRPFLNPLRAELNYFDLFQCCDQKNILQTDYSLMNSLLQLMLHLFIRSLLVWSQNSRLMVA